MPMLLCFDYNKSTKPIANKPPNKIPFSITTTPCLDAPLLTAVELAEVVLLLKVALPVAVGLAAVEVFFKLVIIAVAVELTELATAGVEETTIAAAEVEPAKTTVAEGELFEEEATTTAAALLEAGAAALIRVGTIPAGAFEPLTIVTASVYPTIEGVESEVTTIVSVNEKYVS